MMPDNDYYGHRTALARYCNTKKLSPAVYGTIRHGWQPSLGTIGNRRITSAPIFVWNEREAREAAHRSIPNVIAIGAPFIYAVATLTTTNAATSDPTSDPTSDTATVHSPPNLSPPGAGTIVFPQHSDGTGAISQNVHRLIRDTEANEPGPYTASVFYQDLTNPNYAEPFRDAGWRIITFGSRADPNFMTRLIIELTAHAAVVSDTACSAIWYAAHLNKRIRVLGEPPTVTRTAGSTVIDLAEHYPELHTGGIDGPAAQQLAAVELGVNQMREPDELATLLGWTTWRRYAAPAIRTILDARHGNDLRRGEPQSRAHRQTHAT